MTRVDYLGTGIGNLDAAKRYLRRKFNLGQSEPIIRRPGARFYVTVRSGRKVGFLLGPYVSHMTALANVDRARRMAREADPRGASGASFGAASLPASRPTVFGR